MLKSKIIAASNESCSTMAELRGPWNLKLAILQHWVKDMVIGRDGSQIWGCRGCPFDAKNAQTSWFPNANGRYNWYTSCGCTSWQVQLCCSDETMMIKRLVCSSRGTWVTLDPPICHTWKQHPCGKHLQKLVADATTPSTSPKMGFYAVSGQTQEKVGR